MPLFSTADTLEKAGILKFLDVLLDCPRRYADLFYQLGNGVLSILR